MTEPRPQSRAGGRSERKRVRAAGPVENPCPPGQTGGQYRPLADADMQAIFETALELLRDPGMGEVPAIVEQAALAQGAFLNDAGRTCFPRALIEDAIARAAKTFTLHARDPDRSIEVGGDAVHFGTGGAAVQVLDLETQEYRPSTLRDLFDFTRLQDRLPNISWFTRCCVATDMANERDLDINTVFALLKGTTRPVATSFTLPEHVEPIVRMLDMADDRAGGFVKRPWLKAHVSPVLPPLRYGEDAVAVTLECLRHNIPLSCITAAMSGGTAPAEPAGFLAQSLADTLAGLMLVHLFKPGHPMVFSNWPMVIDLRTGAMVGGGAEAALLNAASAQLSNWLGLPSGVASSMTDSKVLDAQYGLEKASTALAAGLAGGNLIYESAGMTASLLGVSFEGFVADNEIIAMVYRIMRGIEVTPGALDTDAMRAAILGDGHFLGGAGTLASMERDYYYPDLSDRNEPQSWAELGALDLKDRARARAREMLALPDPEYLAKSAEAKIRDAFDIRLPEGGA